MQTLSIMNRSDKRRNGFSKKPRVALLTLLLAPLTGTGQGVEIHRCPQADGTVAFQETPCPESAHTGKRDGEGHKESSAEAASRAPGVDDRDDDSEESPAPAVPRLQTPSSTERTECERMTRDAIDAIDDEIRKNSSKEARQTYLGELLDLTQQLRACKQL